MSSPKSGTTEPQSVLWQRAALIRAVRRFFDDQGYLEVETPIRLPSLVPEPHLLPQPAGSWFLQTSPEICMKRLLARGYPQIYQICKCFRRQERGQNHVPEFTMLEWYRAGADYHDLMGDCEQLLVAIATELPTLAGPTINLSLPWERLKVRDAFRRYANIDAAEALRRDLFEELLVEKIEPRLGLERPVFLYDYPIELAALAKPKADSPQVAERFELYLAGLELANGFSELTNVEEQRCRFEADLRLIQAAGHRPPPLPERFLDELGAMPEAAGIALGIDRLVMILLGMDQIDSVLAFPPEQL